MADPVILAQKGANVFLMDVGDGDQDGHKVARIYDRARGVLHGAWNRESIIARGYWNDPPTDKGLIQDVTREVSGLV
jgi:hypothetical protein